MTEHEYLTLQEVADMLRVHRCTVQRYLKRGAIEGSKLGTNGSSEWRIEREAVRAYLTSRSNRQV
jgi:excisionase family DNA binding protein